MRNAARRAVLVTAAVLGAGLLGFTVLPPPTEDRAGRHVITVGVYENAPKVYTEANGRPAGLFIELLQEIAAREGWTLQFVECLWAQCLDGVDQGEIDIMPDVAYSEERRRRFDFHNVAAANSWSQIYRNAQVDIRSIMDLENRRVAVLRAAIQEDFLNNLITGADLKVTLVPVEDYDEGFAAVRDGLADAVVTNAFFGSRFADRYGLIETPILFNPVGLFFATGKAKNKVLLQRIDHYLAQWRQDSESIYFVALRAAMMPAPVTIVPRWLKITLWGTAGAVLLLIGFSVVLRWQVRRATEALQRTHRRLEQVLGASPVVLYLLRPEGGGFVTEWVSPNVERLYGFAPEQAQARDWLEKQLHPEDRETVLANFERHIGQPGQLTQEYRILDAKGRTRYIHDERRFASEVDGRMGQVVGTWTDLTDAVKQAAELRFLTQYEPVTGLPNRARLYERLNRVLSRAGRKAAKVAVLSIEFDRSRHAGSIGHVQADAMMRMAARKVEALAGIDDMVAKVDDDSFVLVLGGETSAERAAAVAEQLLRVCAQPLSPDFPVTIPLSVGISLFPDHGADVDTLLRNAELARAEAENNGPNTYRLFAAEFTTLRKERTRMEAALRAAVARKELVLHYQPQLDLQSGKIVGVESLVRWNRAESGILHPGEFLPLAEETGIIQEVGAWVLWEACRQLKAWQDAGLNLGRMAVNLSGLQFEKQLLAALVADVLRQTGLPAASLELEIAEATVMRDPEKAIAIFRELKGMGVYLTIDDFGTGRSSLADLKRMPVDRVKIDQIFVRDLGRDADDDAVCRTVIEMGRSLGLETVAEGVEREEQAAFLRAEGCAFAQGFLFGRPLPAEALQNAWGRRVAVPKAG